ncbi:hypothetical protein LMJF_20_1060 [Leishmania major strain Friedlin]|uniref:Uncharacterized protein n=1 Tax=Leishmania major TaxID=5664 RepID=Q4QCU0_LEIMA|nr:hypothetical protein LMJF_20_1060 [Leishmania major strain Friedlin]CAG9573177.1 hypothetical_protein_-_conserved [Leishmania major strain Friedlin]CAJ04097.1 hypothetical protein LMJF_20_1060 [Leishmania major strain Friedlin]|eukprot:XP_001682858.1 hypothetical protein LMJF_20_1060 [Leishmania major strain Friedlin]
MHNGNGNGGFPWRQQQAMYSCRQNPYGGGRPDANVMAVRQQQQLQYYQQQRTQGMWIAGANQMYPGVGANMRNGNLMMQQRRYFGHDGDGMHQYHQHQRQFRRENNVNPTVPQQEGLAESRPGRTPCSSSWWSSVLPHMRLVDSPCGIDLDVEDENANVMEELRKTGSKAGTGMSNDTEVAAPAFVGAFESAKGAGELPQLIPTLALVLSPAVAAGREERKSAERDGMQVTNLYQSNAHPQQHPGQSQASLQSRTDGVPPPRQQKPQQHLSGDYSAVAGSLDQQAIGDAEGKEGEHGAGKQSRSAQPRSADSEDSAGGMAGAQPALRKCQSEGEPRTGSAQQDQGTVALRLIHTPRCTIGEHQEPPTLPQAASDSAHDFPRGGARYSYMGGHNEADEEEDKDDGGCNNSDEYSGDSDSDGSGGSSSSSFDSDSEGSDTDDEAECSTMRHNSQSAFGGQSTLEYSTFHGASTSNLPSDAPLIGALGQPHHTTAPNAGIRGVAMSSFSLCHSVIHTPPANAVFAGNSATVHNNSTSTATGTEDSDKHGYETGILMTAETVLKHTNRTGPVGAGAAEGVPSPRTGTPPSTATTLTATKAVPPAATKRKEDAPALPRQVVRRRKSVSSSVKTLAARSGTSATNDASKTAAAPLPGVHPSSKPERLKSGAATAELQPMKGASKSPDSSKAVSSTGKDENPLPTPSNIKCTASVKNKKTAKVATTASERATASVTTTTPIAVQAPQAPPLPTTGTQHVLSKPMNSLRSVQGLSSHGKQRAAPPRLGKAKTAAMAVTNQSTAKFHQPPSAATSTVAPYFATDPPLPTNAGSAAWATAGAASVAEPKPVAQPSATLLRRSPAWSSPDGSAPVPDASPTPLVAARSLSTLSGKVPAGSESITATEKAASTAPFEGTLSDIGSRGDRLHGAVAQSLRINLFRSPQPRPPAPLSQVAGEAAGNPPSSAAAARAAVAHHRLQPQRPSNASLRELSTAKNALGKKGKAAVARATPPNEATASVPKSSATAGAPKSLSTELLSSIAPSKPTSATATAAVIPPARDATADVTTSSPSMATGTSIPTATVKSLATPSATKNSLTTVSSAAAKPSANGVIKTAVVSALGNTGKQSFPTSSGSNSSAAASTSRGRPPPLSVLVWMNQPKTITKAAAAPPGSLVSVSRDSNTPSHHNNQKLITNGDDDDDAWLDDPYDYYGYGEADLPDSKNYSAVKPSPPKAPASNHATHRHSMVGSLAVSPLNASSTVGKTDAASGAGARLRPLGNADMLEEMGYMYHL